MTLTPVSHALSELLRGLAPVEAAELAVTKAVGAILAEELRAPRQVPDRAVALRRGWAVASADIVGASPYLPMPLGDKPTFVEAGDALPPGVDAVLPPDAVAAEAGFAQALADTAPGVLVRRAGEDVREGVVLRAAGEILEARHAGIARLAGVQTCRIRRPILRILHDGSDASEAIAALVAGIARGAGAATALACRRGGGGIARAECDGADALVLLGRDVGSRPDLFERPTADGFALRPGEATACGLIGAVPALAVTGGAADALAVALVLLRPVLARLAGAREPRPRSRPLTRKIASAVGLTEIALLRETSAGFEPLGSADLTLTALAWADAWLAAPPESEGFAAGEIVAALSL